MIDVSETGLKELMQSLENAADNIPREIYSALSAAAKPVKKEMAREIVKDLNVPQKVPMKQMKVHKDRHNLTVTVSLVKSWRIPLKEFKPTVSKRNGVSAKVRGKTKKSYPNAFRIDSLGGHIFTRSKMQAPRVMKKGRYKGKVRQPITKLRGPSPWGVLAKNPEKLANLTQASREAVLLEIRKRIRYLELKKRGGLNWQQNENETTDTSEG